MWSTRRRAMRALDTELRAEAGIIYQAFELIDEMIEMFRASPQPTHLSVTCGLVLLKGRYLGQGIFSLALDGLAQEAGALLRPMIECFELLTYFHEDPQRITEAIEDRLPKAGKIAKRTQGSFKDLRSHLSAHASHLSLTPASMLHLIDWREGDWKVIQPYNENVLRENMSHLFLTLVLLSFEAASCLSVCGRLPESMVDRLNLWRDNGRKVFESVAQLINQSPATSLDAGLVPTKGPFR